MDTDKAQDTLKQKTYDIEDATKRANDLLKHAKKVLILCSSPPDADSFGTGLAIGEWLQKSGKDEVQVASRYPIPDTFVDFPGIEEIKILAELTEEEFIETLSQYDLLIVEDTPIWSKVLGNEYDKILQYLRDGQKPVIHIDHHGNQEIHHSDFVISVSAELSSTAEVFYTYLLRKSETLHIDTKIADHLYLAIVGDTGYFAYENVSASTFAVASELLEAGADHDKWHDINIHKNAIDFIGWAIQKTRYDADLKLMYLVITPKEQEELEQIFGTDWLDYNHYYKAVVLRKVRGYDYGIFVYDQPDGTSKFSWRTRNYGETADLRDLLAGAEHIPQVGGHRGAGGGTCGLNGDGFIDILKNKLRQYFDNLT